ncbi:uncharacterized protein [Manis javanica]|uniref:uncharacterized protein isoform X2 n=1 Tax=Manis javanica TaxID=9974 RepID=UPI003C6CCEAB
MRGRAEAVSGAKPRLGDPGSRQAARRSGTALLSWLGGGPNGQWRSRPSLLPLVTSSPSPLSTFLSGQASVPGTAALRVCKAPVSEPPGAKGSLCSDHGAGSPAARGRGTLWVLNIRILARSVGGAAPRPWTPAVRGREELEADRTCLVPSGQQELTATLNRNCLWGVASGRGSSAVLVWHCCAEMGPQIAPAGTLAKVHGVFQPQVSPDLRCGHRMKFQPMGWQRKPRVHLLGNIFKEKGQ